MEVVTAESATGGATLEAPRGTQRPWAPGAPRDHVGVRTDVPRYMDESDDPTGMDEVDSLKQRRQRQQRQQP